MFERRQPEREYLSTIYSQGILVLRLKVEDFGIRFGKVVYFYESIWFLKGGACFMNKIYC